MNDIDKLHLYAIQLAQEQESPNMVMTIEKELLHYEILNAMDEGGLLDHLVFQGVPAYDYAMERSVTAKISISQADAISTEMDWRPLAIASPTPWEIGTRFPST